MVFRKILKTIFMGPKLLENSTYSVQANNSHVMVLPEYYSELHSKNIIWVT